MQRPGRKNWRCVQMRTSSTTAGSNQVFQRVGNNRLRPVHAQRIRTGEETKRSTATHREVEDLHHLQTVGEEGGEMDGRYCSGCGTPFCFFSVVCVESTVSTCQWKMLDLSATGARTEAELGSSAQHQIQFQEREAWHSQALHVTPESYKET